jgi:hypothetical protein
VDFGLSCADNDMHVVRQISSTRRIQPNDQTYREVYIRLNSKVSVIGSSVEAGERLPASWE